MYYENNTLYCCRDCFSITKRIIFIDKITVLKFIYLNLSKNHGRVRRTVLVFFFNSVLYYRNINLKKKTLWFTLIYIYRIKPVFQTKRIGGIRPHFMRGSIKRFLRWVGGLRDNFVKGGGGCSRVILITLFC